MFFLVFFSPGWTNWWKNDDDRSLPKINLDVLSGRKYYTYLGKKRVSWCLYQLTVGGLRLGKSSLRLQLTYNVPLSPPTRNPSTLTCRTFFYSVFSRSFSCFLEICICCVMNDEVEADQRKSECSYTKLHLQTIGYQTIQQNFFSLLHSHVFYDKVAKILAKDSYCVKLAEKDFTS